MNWAWPVDFLRGIWSQMAASPLVFSLVFVLFFSSSLSTFYVRCRQAMRVGDWPEGDPVVPEWVGNFLFVDIAIFVALLVMDWRLAIKIWCIRFALKVLPVLEVIGNILLAPFRPRA